jgi:hypothetical protein
MATGKDVANFIAQMTGDDSFVDLYAQSKEDEAMKMEMTKRNFSNILERMEKSDKNSYYDKID